MFTLYKNLKIDVKSKRNKNKDDCTTITLIQIKKANRHPQSDLALALDAMVQGSFVEPVAGIVEHFVVGIHFYKHNE